MPEEVSVAGSGQDTAQQVNTSGTGSNSTGKALSAAGQANAGGAIAGLIFMHKKKRLARQARNIERQERYEKYNESMANSLLNEGDTLREGGMEKSALEANMADRGLGESSIRKDALANQQYQQNERLNAIQRARARLKHGYEAGEKLIAIQRKADRIAMYEQQIAAVVNTAVSVAGAVV